MEDVKNIWATTRENVPSDKKIDIRETSLILKRNVSKSNSFSLTGLFKVLC